MKNKGFTPLEIERKRKRSRFLTGFTLIELLVVVVVIGILAGMSFVMIQGVIDTARMARSKSFSKSIQLQLALNEVGVWRFDDDHSPTRVHDDSGWGNHGTLHLGNLGNTTPDHAWVSGVFGRSLRFDGSDDFVSVLDSASLDTVFGSRNFTLEAWINSRDWVDRRGIISKRDNGLHIHQPAGLFTDFGGVRFVIADGTVAGNNHLTYRPSLNKWHHIIGTADGTTMRLFINAELKGVPITITASPISNNDILRIGGFFGQRTFNGRIDEPRIYNRALQVFEIQQRYVKGLKSLLARGIITDEEFNNRIAEKEKNLAINRE